MLGPATYAVVFLGSLVYFGYVIGLAITVYYDAATNEAASGRVSRLCVWLQKAEQVGVVGANRLAGHNWRGV